VKALVTGGAGYIGGAVAEALLEQGHRVEIVDNLSTGDRANVPSGAVLHELSVGDEAGLAIILSATHFDVCLHFAGLIAAGISMSQPEDYLVNNVAETLSLLRVLVAHHVPKFVFSSSATVYGDPLYTPIDEEHRLQTVNPYGESKLLVEQALAWLSRLGHLRTATLRYFNAAGAVGGRPERHRPETHLIPLAFEAAAGERDALELFGDDYETRDGTCVRDYIHLADLASAHLLAVDALDRHESITCNLGTGTGSSNREVLDVIAQVTGREVPVRVVGRRPGDSATLVAANDRARTLLGWTPTRTLHDIVADAWAARGSGSGATGGVDS
jgi:UDP-glucose 4-epimerase